MKRVAIIGASGAVGREILSLLEERNFPVQTLRCFASASSLGKNVFFRKESIPLETLADLTSFDLLFFCAGSSISREWIPHTTGFVIDSSSAFRAQVPLIIPEINGHTLLPNTRIVSSPNCAATILLMPLFKLHRLFRIKRIITSTYQAASGGGAKLVQKLEEETKGYFENRQFSQPYAFNLYPHNSKLHESGYVEEELKMLHETRKILEDETIQLSATCVRVPVFRAHSLSANVEFHHPVSLVEITQLWKETPGLRLFEDRAKNRFATPLDATGMDDVLCGRLRLDQSQPNTIEFWAVGDQLRKGAALNAVQIAELFESKGA